jgi:Transglutaminase-like superfamily
MTQHPHVALSAHVRACASGDQIILLDLRHNRYIGISGRQRWVLSGVVEGWPRPAGSPLALRACLPAREARTTAAIDAAIRPLLAQELLTVQVQELPTSLSLQVAMEPLDAEALCEAVRPRWSQTLHAVRATASASWQLRYDSLQSIAKHLAALQLQLQKRPLRAPETADALRTSVAAFLRLRPLLFSAKDRCLHDSLALSQYLLRDGHPAIWVVGVRTHPFRAHSWVQSENLVLNDQPEHVRGFTPILAV